MLVLYVSSKFYQCDKDMFNNLFNKLILNIIKINDYKEFRRNIKCKNLNYNFGLC